MNKPLAGRIALVTGAPGPVGRAIARALAMAGGWVVVNYRQDFETAKWLVDAIRSDGGRAMAVFGDADVPEQAWAVVERVDCEWGPVDILVANSGDEQLAAVARCSPQLPARPVAAAFLANLVAAGMRNRGWGRIVAIGATAVELCPVVDAVVAAIGALAVGDGAEPAGGPLPRPLPATGRGGIGGPALGPPSPVLRGGKEARGDGTLPAPCVAGIATAAARPEAVAAAVVAVCVVAAGEWHGRALHPDEILEDGKT